MRTLNVYVQGDSGALTKIWSVTGEKGESWRPASVRLSIASDKKARVGAQLLPFVSG